MRGYIPQGHQYSRLTHQPCVKIQRAHVEPWHAVSTCKTWARPQLEAKRGGRHGTGETERLSGQPARAGWVGEGCEGGSFQTSHGIYWRENTFSICVTMRRRERLVRRSARLDCASHE